MMPAATNLVLYADDDENDAFLIQLAFTKVEIANPLVVVSSGQAAIEYLSAASVNSERAQYPLPCLVLLDLNMPGKSGLEVLKWIRMTPGLSTLVVLVLTSSNQEADIHRAYLHGANGYLVKPGKLEDLVVMAKSIKDFWLLQNRVSPRVSASAAAAEAPKNPPAAPAAEPLDT